MPIDQITLWEWEGGWRLVRPVTNRWLKALYLKLESEAHWAGDNTPGALTRVANLDARGTVIPTFLREPDGVVVMMVQIYPHENGQLRIGPWQYDFHADTQEESLRLNARWLEACFRIYGMATALEPNLTLPGETPMTTFVKFPAAIEPEMQVQVKRHMVGRRSFQEEMSPWFIRGYPPVDSEMYLLLGTLPPGFTEPMLDPHGP